MGAWRKLSDRSVMKRAGLFIVPNCSTMYDVGWKGCPGLWEIQEESGLRYFGVWILPYLGVCLIKLVS